MKETSSDSPLKGNTIETDIPDDTAESCRRKYNSLKEAQKLHKLNDINYRLEILNKLLLLWDKYADEVALSNYLDLGITEAGNTISNYCIVRNEILHAIRNLKCWVKPRYVDTPLFLATSSCYVKPEPYGLVLIFSAWNCNFLTLLVPLVQAIAAGNCVIAKPASTAKETCKVCRKILNELPHDVVYGCSGKPEVYTELLAQRWDLIIFTGSAAKGKIIAQAAAPCIAPEYIMVDRTIKDKLIDELKKTFEIFYTKNPEKSPEIGLIINEHYAKRIKELIENPGQGAKLIYGELSKINLEKRFIPPFLFEFDDFDSMKKSNLAAAEIFGPVLYLCPYDKIEEAVDYMNSREKPLSGYLFTKDSKTKEYVRDNTTSGCLDINETLLHFSSSFLPFGGVGNSGMSAYHGKWGFDNMSHLKPVIDQASMLFSFRYPPYSKTSLGLSKRVLLMKYSKRQVIRCLLCLILIILFVVCILPKFLGKK